MHLARVPNALQGAAMARFHSSGMQIVNHPAVSLFRAFLIELKLDLK